MYFIQTYYSLFCVNRTPLEAVAQNSPLIPVTTYQSHAPQSAVGPRYYILGKNVNMKKKKNYAMLWDALITSN